MRGPSLRPWVSSYSRPPCCLRSVRWLLGLAPTSPPPRWSLRAGAEAGSDKRGDVEVAVKHSVAFIERTQLRVREELETLARNEAPGLQADTIPPLSDAIGGAQRWAAWHCGG